MGEVYRARDTTLNRDVAIKVLPDLFASDAERLARFTREAQTLASLNHPNIAHIHGLEESNGVRALVMELVEGEDLSQRIARGPISIDEALPIAKQIAEALEAAHEQGIIHRDLKPANIKIRPDGAVKVLDFGLAKAMEPTTTGQPSLSQSPTITSPALMTGGGMILGTAAYMSPEQAKGRPVDKRADVWAFGTVLFEMLVGRRAFEGEDVSDTLANVLKQEPEWDSVPADVPPHVRQVIRRCLQKDRKQRISDIQDVRLALAGAFDTTATQTTPAAPIEQPSWRRALPVAAALVVGGLVVGLAAWSVWPTPPPPTVTRFGFDVPASQPLRNLDRTGVAISLDGQAVVYNGRGGLFLVTMDDPNARAIAGTEAALSNPFFSPNGQWLGFFQDGQLKRIPVGGGTPVRISAATSLFGASWEADDTILFGQPAGILRVSAKANGGEPQVVIPVGEGERVYGPHLLPDGDTVLFSSTTTDWLETQIVAQSLSRRTRTVLGPGHAARYLASGHLVYAQGNALFAVAFDAARLAVTGAPLSVVQGIRRSFMLSAGSTAAAFYAVSDTGTLVYATAPPAAPAVRRQLSWVDRKGNVLSTLGAPDVVTLAPDVSPDGQRVAVMRSTEGGASHIWLVDALKATQVTFGTDSKTFPLWSFDGSRISYSKGGGRPRGLYAVPSSGAGSEETIFLHRNLNSADSWSPDGRFILADVAPNDIMVLPVGEGGKPFPFVDTPAIERLGQFSHDGRWVAYQSNASGGRAEIYVRPFVAPDDLRPRVGQTRISNDGGAQPRWRHDGRELYWIAPDGTFMSAPMTLRDDSVTAGAPVALFPAHIVLGGSDNPARGQYAVAPDGRFLINRVVDDQPASPQPPQQQPLTRIAIVQNWTEELKRLVPTQ